MGWGTRQSWRLYGRLLWVPFVLSLIDATVTLVYQPAPYWQGDRSVVLEGNPVVWVALRIHPLMMVPGFAGWYALMWFLMFKTAAWIGLRLCAFLVLGHQAAIAGWLVRFHDHGVWLTAGMVAVFVPLGWWVLRPYFAQWESKVPVVERRLEKA